MLCKIQCNSISFKINYQQLYTLIAINFSYIARFTKCFHLNGPQDLYSTFFPFLLVCFHDNLFREMENKNTLNVCLMCFNRANYPHGFVVSFFTS